VALIKRYFGGKEALFTEALKASFRPEGWHQYDRASFAREIAEMMAGGAHANEERAQSFQFLLRAATSPATAPLLSVALQDRFLAFANRKIAMRNLWRGALHAGVVAYSFKPRLL